MSITRSPKTIVVYNITGQPEYTIPFEYLARKFVVVTLIGQDRKVLTLNTDYRFTTKTTISLSDPNPAGYTTIEIRRFTSATDRLVDFHDGSILRAYDLNLSQIQTLHVAEEARDLAGDSIAVDDKGQLDARGRRIVNLGDAKNDGDAVNLAMLKKFDDSTFNNAQDAQQSATKAFNSENAAKNSEVRCLEAETKSVASAGIAMTAAADANKSKVAAGTSEVNAKTSETKAKESETKAKESELKAEQEAAKLQNYNDLYPAIEPITNDSIHFNRDVEVTNIADGSKVKVTQIKTDVTRIETEYKTADETLNGRVNSLSEQKFNKTGGTLTGAVTIRDSSVYQLHLDSESPSPLVIERVSQTGIEIRVGSLIRYLGVDVNGNLRFGDNQDHSKNRLVSLS